MERRRADVVLAERGLFPSREKARAAILAGDVSIGGRVIRKAGEPIDDDAVVQIREVPQFVSRGGIKLAHALDVFRIDVAGLRAVDVGASAGGFTDCLLQRGAVHVTAIDVGYGQFAWKLRNDERVTVCERTNIRNVVSADLGAPFDVATVDVSFISLVAVLPHVLDLLAEDGFLLGLVKPQFEAGKARVGKRGVVRDPETHVDVLSGVCEAVRKRGLIVRGLAWSPIKGPEGNIEFWVWAAHSGEATSATPEDTVRDAHGELGV